MPRVEDSLGRSSQVWTVLLLSLAALAGCGQFRKKKEVSPERQPGALTGAMPGNNSSCSLSTNPLALIASDIETFHFVVDGIPLCSQEGRLVRGASDQTDVILGPDLSARTLLAPDVSEWPGRESAISFARSAEGLDSSFRLRAVSACWYLQGDTELMSAYEMLFVSGVSSRRVVASDEQVFESGSAGFDATARLNIQREGADPGVEEMAVELDGSGFLVSNDFRTVIDGGGDRAYAADQQFLFGPDDRRFDEVSSFGTATRILDWYRSMGPGFVDTECFPLDIRLHVIFPPDQGVKNNARYDPAVLNDSGRPAILLGDGDGSVLQNLGRDPDVLAHEFGHHIVYRGVRDSTDFQSRSIHEGLADYLVFARTGNACIGETICPEGSGACTRTGCLRTGENDLTFAESARSYYKAAQVISGMLWDLQQGLDWGAEQGGPGSGFGLAKNVVSAVSYLPSRSTFRDLIVALMLANKDLFGGVHACSIFAAAESRGLADALSGVDCAQFGE